MMPLRSQGALVSGRAGSNHAGISAWASGTLYDNPREKIIHACD